MSNPFASGGIGRTFTFGNGVASFLTSPPRSQLSNTDAASTVSGHATAGSSSIKSSTLSSTSAATSSVKRVSMLSSVSVGDESTTVATAGTGGTGTGYGARSIKRASVVSSAATATTTASSATGDDSVSVGQTLGSVSSPHGSAARKFKGVVFGKGFAAGGDARSRRPTEDSGYDSEIRLPGAGGQAGIAQQPQQPQQLLVPQQTLQQCGESGKVVSGVAAPQGQIGQQPSQNGSTSAFVGSGEIGVAGSAGAEDVDEGKIVNGTTRRRRRFSLKLKNRASLPDLKGNADDGNQAAPQSGDIGLMDNDLTPLASTGTLGFFKFGRKLSNDPSAVVDGKQTQPRNPSPARTPMRGDSTEPAAAGTEVPKGHRRSPSPKRWFTPKMVRESPGRAPALGGIPRFMFRRSAAATEADQPIVESKPISVVAPVEPVVVAQARMPSGGVVGASGSPRVDGFEKPEAPSADNMRRRGSLKSLTGSEGGVSVTQSLIAATSAGMLSLKKFGRRLSGKSIVTEVNGSQSGEMPGNGVKAGDSPGGHRDGGEGSDNQGDDSDDVDSETPSPDFGEDGENASIDGTDPFFKRVSKRVSIASLKQTWRDLVKRNDSDEGRQDAGHTLQSSFFSHASSPASEVISPASSIPLRPPTPPVASSDDESQRRLWSFSRNRRRSSDPIPPETESSSAVTVGPNAGPVNRIPEAPVGRIARGRATMGNNVGTPGGVSAVGVFGGARKAPSRTSTSTVNTPTTPTTPSDAGSAFAVKVEASSGKLAAPVVANSPVVSTTAAVNVSDALVVKSHHAAGGVASSASVQQVVQPAEKKSLSRGSSSTGGWTTMSSPPEPAPTPSTANAMPLPNADTLSPSAAPATSSTGDLPSSPRSLSRSLRSVTTRAARRFSIRAPASPTASVASNVGHPRSPSSSPLQNLANWGQTKPTVAVRRSLSMSNVAILAEVPDRVGSEPPEFVVGSANANGSEPATVATAAAPLSGSSNVTQPQPRYQGMAPLSHTKSPSASPRAWGGSGVLAKSSSLNDKRYQGGESLGPEEDEDVVTSDENAGSGSPIFRRRSAPGMSALRRS
ncbi:hypothetical protein HDU76_007733 [Blyttiomyces sp. JEL0837]|nr:hypothetical protein HDU76_007733 [Blyttiomyces sp. JEL0837]